MLFQHVALSIVQNTRINIILKQLIWPVEMVSLEWPALSCTHILIFKRIGFILLWIDVLGI